MMLRHTGPFLSISLSHDDRVYDETLSRAVVIYIWGVDGLPWPSHRPEALTTVFGDQALDLLPRVQSVLAGVNEDPPDEKEDLAIAGRRVEASVRRRHPYLSDEAAKAVANLFTYAWR